MTITSPIKLSDYARVVIFTGAGMSAESGVPTYRGSGGIWNEYRWEEFACQRAFDADPDKVMDFHEMRRGKVLECQPHAGHRHLAELQKTHPDLQIVTQNIDGMHQRAGSTKVTELHGSLWRLRCRKHGIIIDLQAAAFQRRACQHCGSRLRPDITWFEDSVNQAAFNIARTMILGCDLFVVVGCSMVVQPAASLIPAGIRAARLSVEINPEATPLSADFHRSLRGAASAEVIDSFVN